MSWTNVCFDNFLNCVYAFDMNFQIIYKLQWLIKWHVFFTLLLCLFSHLFILFFPIDSPVDAAPVLITDEYQFHCHALWTTAQKQIYNKIQFNSFCEVFIFFCSAVSVQLYSIITHFLYFFIQALYIKYHVNVILFID